MEAVSITTLIVQCLSILGISISVIVLVFKIYGEIKEIGKATGEVSERVGKLEERNRVLDIQDFKDALTGFRENPDDDRSQRR